MKIDVSEAQARHFTSTGKILLEGVLSPQEKEVILSQKEGVELWRNNEELKKVALSKNLGYIALALTKKRPLRLLFDSLGIAPIELATLPYQGVQLAFSFDLVTQEEHFHLTQVTPVNPTYVVVYGEELCRYLETKPPYPFPKKLGYGYGDRLLPKDYPYLIK